MTLLRILSATLIIQLAAFAGGKEVRTAVSLRYSCYDKPFLSVSVSTLQRNTFPSVELRILDPLGRSFGTGSNGERNPRSQSGRVVEIPKHQQHSKAIAVEICDAIPGDYSVDVSELSNAQYWLSVSADDGKTGNEAI